jgi:hypothetical protein
MMRRPTAAAYCDMSIAEFERQVAAGLLPCPVALGKVQRWSKVQLDKTLAAIAGDFEQDWRVGSPLYDGGSECRT